ncbi:MAG: tyrosine-type recombinase/integrase [Hahellaceae bacterium]|nr:tyrosine-type recombinase/integrase [Hahellaceae bacterium]MCP5168139.1 tyrosine-type recombinase/integrase [Hahellaceae bacterium]
MGKLTDAKISKASPKTDGGDTVLSDGDGLCLRIRRGTNGNSKTWLFRYKRPSNGKPAKLVLGEYPGMSLKEARACIPDLRAQVGEGIDPKYTKAAKIARNAAILTMGQLFDQWIVHLEKTSDNAPTTLQGHRWRWNKYLAKPLKDIRVPDITRAHLSSALFSMREHTRAQTSKGLTTLRLMLDFAMTLHMIEENLARLLRPGDFGASKSRPRRRHLQLEELRELWRALEESKVPPTTAAAIKILILTGARRSEVVNMAWGELDLAKGIWVLPSERAKNREEHVIYLSPLALRIIESLRPLTEVSGWVFESDRERCQGKPIHKDTLNTVLERLSGRYPGQDKEKAPLRHLEHFTIHDLRRTAATAWGEHLKAMPDLIEKMLNHKPENQLKETYQRQKLAEEQRVVWCAWGDIVAHRVAKDPDNVTPITTARKAAL